MPVTVDMSKLQVTSANRVECKGAVIELTSANGETKVSLKPEFDTSHQRHCVECYFADGADTETFSTHEKEKNTIAVVSLEEFRQAFAGYCKTFVQWLADQYAATENPQAPTAVGFQPGMFETSECYRDRAGLKFQTDSNLTMKQSFESLMNFCKTKKKTEHRWPFHCFPIAGPLAVELGLNEYNAFKQILRFLGYLQKSTESKTSDLLDTTAVKSATSKCQNAVRLLETDPQFQQAQELELLRNTKQMSSVEIALLLWSFDQLELYIKLKRILTSEQVIRFARSITKPDAKYTDILESLNALQRLFDLVGGARLFAD